MILGDCAYVKDWTNQQYNSDHSETKEEEEEEAQSLSLFKIYKITVLFGNSILSASANFDYLFRSY